MYMILKNVNTTYIYDLWRYYMKKNTRKRSWLYYFYKENMMYIWVVVGIVIVSGFSIGMSIGKLTDRNSNIINNGDVNHQVASNENRNNYSVITEISENQQKNNVNTVTYNQGEKDISKETVIETRDDKPDETSKTGSQAKVVSVEATSTNIEKQIVKEVKKLEFIMPIVGEVMRDYTQDTLVFSNTLQQWISHEGIDILSEIASPVKAIEAGEVIEVKNDPRYGLIIIIDHGQGYQSVYCNLSTLDMVHVGKKVEKGQVVSGVGNTALFEIKDNPHLHFELIKDGANVNPTEYIK